MRDTFGGVFGWASLPASRTECRLTIPTRGHFAWPDALRIFAALGWSMIPLWGCSMMLRIIPTKYQACPPTLSLTLSQDRLRRRFATL